jgi:hypothetical protein
MADIRIKDLASTATTTASGDFMAVDGTTNGTRKLSAAAPAFLTSVTTPSLTSPAATNLTLGLGTGGTALTLTSSTLAATFAGATNVQLVNQISPVRITQLSDADIYGVITFNGVNTIAGYAGMFGGGSTNRLFLNVPTGGDVNMRVNNSNVLFFDASGLAITGAVTVSTGAAVGGATAGAGGLAFPASDVAVANANTLDDYEEGTWTPTLSPVTSGTITVVSPNLCGYTKIGRVVTVNGLIEASSVSLPVGATVNVGGLPFPSNGNTNERSVGTVRAFSLTSGALNSTAIIASSTQTASLFIDASLFQAASQFYFQLTYTV